uniref:NADH dehydrogenase subunit 6 n=1 Tax=Dalbulus maidis TaxID=74065 RepID=UPI0022FD9AEC|nr:NADH dehydrogenase subunit 6 [Dalbulus maidis]WAS32277.1 NADH dehydrogenase subunit 6 [Dalbulus maidis]
MKMMIIKVMMSISTTISLMKTPISMGMLLLMQTMMTTMLISMTSNTSWMTMVIFLMMIGGMLILFMYMSSVAGNEKFTNNYKTSFIVMLMLMLPLEELMNEMNINEFQNSYINNESITFMKIYNKKTMNITLMMFMYMYLTMIVVTKIVKIHKGPLRSK